MSEDGRYGIDPVASAIVLMLFFASGFTGLVYEIFWLKELSLLFGNTARAAATTLAAFFLGLAMGSTVWGRWSSRLTSPLQAYALLEMAVALSAVSYFFLSDLYFIVYAPLFGVLGKYPILFTMVKLVLAMGVLLPPAFFMGGTFPVLSRHWVGRPSFLGTRATLLYSVNTLGAVFGACAAGFLFPRLLGYQKGYFFTMAMTAAIAVAAWVMGRKYRLGPPPAYPRGVVSTESPQAPVDLTFPVIHTLAFLSGFTALGLEVLWTRMFAQVLQNSVYSFSLILAVFIASLALGAALASFLARQRLQATLVLSALLSMAGFLVGVSPFIFVRLTGLAYQGNGFDFQKVLSSIALVIFLPGLFLGTVFPYLMKLCEPAARHVGQTVGRMAAFNTTGAIVGSLCTGFIFISHVGLWSSIRMMAVVYLLMALFAAESISGKRFFFRMIPMGVLLLLVTGLDVARLPLMQLEPLEKNEHLVEIWEGSAANVAVVKQDDFLRIMLNNHYQLGETRSHAVEEFQAHLPLLLHPQPETVFFLGMGTGITAGAALQHSVKKVVVTELVPEVIDASRKYFTPYLHGLFEDPRARIIAEDGRNYLLGTQERFDLIISDLFLPWKAGVGSLYTREHFAATRQRLQKNGLFAQWLPLYQISDKEFGIIARTMLEVFPLVTLWRADFLGARYVLLLMGHNDPVDLDPEGLRQRFSAASLAGQDARRIFTTGDFAVPTHLLPLFHYCGNLTAKKGYFDPFPINTDNHPIVEYRAPLIDRNHDETPSPFFIGSPLIDFLSHLLHAAPSIRDGYLEKFSENQQKLIHAGFRLHKARILKVDQSAKAVGRELDHFRKEVLTAKNVKKLYVPITSKEAALKYYLFLMRNLGTAWEDCVIYLLKPEDYTSPELHQWFSNPAVYKNRLAGRITRLADTPEGFRITLIGFNPTFPMAFFERTLLVKSDGAIQELSQQTLLAISD